MATERFEDLYELSSMQQGMLFHSLYAPDEGVYCEQVACALEGGLDVPAFRRAWEQVVERHPVLRTGFHWRELEKPLQVVYRSIELPWEESDWRGLSTAEQEERLEAYLAAGRSSGFSLDRAPVLRLALFRTGEASYRFVFAFHHILMDGWSLPLVLDEAFAFYQGNRRGEALRKPRPRPYRDFIAWLQGREAEGEEPFWRRRLAGFPAPTPLPGDRGSSTTPAAPPAMEPGDHTEVHEVLSAAESAALQLLARSHQLTLNSILQAAWGLLLARTSGEEDVLFGATVSGRPPSLPGAESMIGLFINTLPVRLSVPLAARLLPWLQQVQEQQAEAREHEHTPLARIRLWSEVPQGQPLFESILVFENQPFEPPADMDVGFKVHGLRIAERTSYPLTLLVIPGPSLRLRAACDLRRLDAIGVARTLGHLRTLLAAMTEGGPDTRLADLPLLPPAERHQLLVEWNGTDLEIPAGLCLHHLVEAQAERTPEALAVVRGAERLTYRDLNRQANRLARHLMRLGVGPEVRVGIFVERSPTLVTALLAVLKAGGIYVPLEHSYPGDRIAYMVADARVRVIVVGVEVEGKLPEQARAPGVHLVRLGSIQQALEAESAANPDSGVLPENLSHAIYTSGSTGRPKGVAIQHGNTVSMLVWALAEFDDEESAVVVLATSISFDVSVFELFFPLARGSRLIVAENILELPALPEAQEITMVNAVPTVMAELLRTERLPASVVTANLGGEAVPRWLVDKIYDHATVRQVRNLYGPSEDTTFTTLHPIERLSERVPIGRPVGNGRMYLLDHGLEPLPVGIPGELYTGGSGVARGYLDRPELTAERFLPDPFAGQPGARMYRVGDVVRLLPDGRFEFLGRIDHQVKIRGFRIELGEIEAVLVGQPGVQEAVVAARQDGTSPRLVAYVVPGDGDTTSPATLRQALRALLPDYMIPADWVMLPALPLTSSGKVDRRALPDPQPATEAPGGLRGPIEETVADIWAQILGHQRVGPHESFFDLGGHSLLATRAISAVRRALGVDIPLRALFEAPSVRMFAAEVEQALRAGQGLSAPPIERVPREGDLPLSFAQQRLWFIDQLEPGSPLYNIPVTLGVEGPLDAAVLALCFGAIARRHEALRTVFAAKEGSPVQVIRPPEPFRLPVVDLSELPERAREALALTLAGEEAAHPFDLACGPLLRCVLLRLAEGEHVVALTMHHIVSDGWSMGILVGEVAALYAALAEARPSPLPELPVQYADFAGWQRSWLRDEILDGEISFWRRQLAGLPPLLELPTDRPRPAVQSFRGATRPLRLPAGLARPLQALGRREGATLFMVLLAGFQVLLARYSRQDDFGVGSPTAGRNRTEIEGLIGFFVNTLVLRGDLSGEPTFRALLGRVRETALAAHMHQDLPFERLVEELAPQRSLAHTPIFQVVLVLQSASRESLEIRDLRLRPVSVPAMTAKFDLTVSLSEHGGGLSGTVEHATDLYDAATIDRLIGHFERLLTAAAAGPDLRAAELPLLSAAESHQLLVEWRGDREQTAAASTLHDRFAAQARLAPNAPALTCSEVTLSYGELHRRSNQLARRLRAQGAGPESRVGLYLDRSPDLVVGILGILKAGAAYVPLDPGSPRERLAYIQEDAGIQIVVGVEELKLLEGSPAGDLKPLADETSLAYVIYTSGSTGRPKGVLVTHRNATRLFDATEAWFGFGERDVWTLFHSFAFDFSVWEIWGALLYGGRLVIVPWDVSRSPELFLDLLIREKVTVLNQTPSAFAQLARLDEERGGVPTDLRMVIFGGEALDPAGLSSWFARHGDEKLRLVNMYGITETTVHVTYRPLSADDVRNAHRSVIGVPIPDLSLAVMDPRLRPVPIGVPGELVIGGAGLARGYLGRPALTAERFVPDPVSGAPGARLYRSGDLGRFLPDGDVEYLGRIDRQVKIRGFRIELGEIEAALTTLAGVSQAAVILREDAPGDRRLVAYVAGEVAADDVLRQALRERLPDYMVPAAFVTLAALPLTANGKVDRKALPAPEWPGTGEDQLAPRTQVEEVLAGIWAEVLVFERVGVHDNFFDLGGHSLLATQVMSRLRNAFGIEMPLRDLFAAPRLTDLAVRVEAALRAGVQPSIPPLVPMRREGVLPQSFAQQQLWFIDQLEPGSPLYNIPVALRAEGPLDGAVLALCLEEVVRRHEVLRTAFATVDGTPAVVIQPAAAFLLPVVDLSELPESTRERLALSLVRDEAGRPFDLAHGPLLRGVLLRLATGDHAVALTMHHIVSDGWSMGILVHEVTALYQAFLEKKLSPLPDLPIQYVDFAAWQRRWLRGEAMESLSLYWKNHLAGAPALLKLPLDHKRPLLPGNRGAVRPYAISQDLSGSLRAIARKQEATLFMILMAGFKALLSCYSGQEDMVIGTNTAGRAWAKLENLIGFFVNMLALRTDLSGDPTFTEILQRVRKTTLEAYSHQEMPFAKVVEELRPERNLSHTPIFQAVLSVQPLMFPKELTATPVLILSPLDSDVSTTPFDLIFNLSETATGVRGSVQYNVELFDASTITRLMERYTALLRRVTEEPEMRLSEIRERLFEDLLSGERERDFGAAARRVLKSARRQAVAVGTEIPD